MKILLATPIYPPEIGGPSQYVKNLEEKFKGKKIETKVVSYSDLRKIPQPFRFLAYFLKVLKNVRAHQIIYAFNLIACGMPSLLCSKSFGKKFVIRLGGDFLWERAVESGRTRKTLREYYESPKTIVEKFWITIIKQVLNGADRIIFNSNFQKDIYKKYFGITEQKTTIIKNPFPEIEYADHQPQETYYQILYAGRLLKLKNLDTLIDAFKSILRQTDKDLTLKIIGEGPEKENLEHKINKLLLQDKAVVEEPLSHPELLKEIRKSYVCILPSLTDISPNFALECVKLRKPILLTKETGISENIKRDLIFINPKNKQNIEEKLLFLLNEDNYKEYIERMKNIPTSYSWREVSEKHIDLFKQLL